MPVTKFSKVRSVLSRDFSSTVMPDAALTGGAEGAGSPALSVSASKAATGPPAGFTDGSTSACDGFAPLADPAGNSNITSTGRLNHSVAKRSIWFVKFLRTQSSLKRFGAHTRNFDDDSS